MIFRMLLLFQMLLHITSHCLNAAVMNLQFQSNYQLSTEPLTTEKIWTLDAGQRNPHIQRWVVARSTDLHGLKAVSVIANKTNHFGLSASGLSTSVQGYVRGLGPWYRQESEFPCTENPNVWFSTQEGAKFAASEAANLWVKLMTEKKMRLTVILERITADSEELAIQRGKEAFRNWIDSLEEEWRNLVKLKIRNAEWNFYRSEPFMKENCQYAKKKEKNKIELATPSIRSMMEVASGDPLPITKILARAPIRLWNGLASVRLSISVGGKTLNGKFLIDSSAYKSVISPAWLEVQGINPAWVMIPGANPQKVRYSELWNDEMRLGRRAFVDRVEMSGLVLPLQEFLLAETDFFSPPENVGSCCDGILGMDFLRNYPLQFRTAGPKELLVWPKEGFHWAADVPWVEITEKENDSWVSSCIVSSERLDSKTQHSDSKTNKKSKSRVNLPGVSWDLGSEDLLTIHSPWQKEAKSSEPAQWSVYCDGFEVANGVEGSYPRPPAGVRNEGLFAEKIPAATVGMPLLSRTGEFTLDIPHGKIWFNGGTRSLENGFKNRSGLSLNFIMNDGERELRVLDIRSQSPAASLLKAGLKKGMWITQIDSKPTHEMDLWEIERRLAGDYGPIVSVQWKSNKDLKMAPLTLKEPSK